MYKAWNGDTTNEENSLAKALVIVVTEVILEYVFKVIFLKR